MCLLLKENDSKVKIAKENIICYKWLVKKTDECMESPYQYKRYTLNSKMKDYKKSDRTKLTTKERCALNVMYSHEINQGGFHTFKNYADAKMLIDTYHTLFQIENNASDVIVKCVIPKGTRYWTGVTPALVDYFENQLFESYASKELIITDVIYTPKEN